jgi:hypothetical protein
MRRKLYHQKISQDHISFIQFMQNLTSNLALWHWQIDLHPSLVCGVSPSSPLSLDPPLCLLVQ